MIRRTLIILAVCAPLSIAGCQCSEKPDIGPVEDETSHQIERPSPSIQTTPVYS